ncbi:MAG: D-cysteine desulfhydrase family protein [Bacteroidetes bacterium]|nr:D-cysteine desulfhydrase family protein [Bacteroidota bacterium]
MNNNLKKFNRLSYSLLPTPVHKLENLSKFFGANIYCKRDDMTGFAFGGNKTRKLDFLIAEAIAQKADTLVCVGANQSNFCRIASAYGAACGLNVELVLGGKKPAVNTGNLLLDYLFGAKITHIDSEDWDVWENEAIKISEELRKKGKKVYWMPIGGSTATGALGYVECMSEIMDYSRKNKIHFEGIIHPTGSAGTQSGLVVGKKIFGYEGNIIGMAVTKNTHQLTEEVISLSRETAHMLETDIDDGTVIVDDNFIGKCYGAHTRKAEDAIKLFARKEGILLDYVYSGKAASGMLDYIRKKHFSKNSNILFIHTGGNIQLFK